MEKKIKETSGPLKGSYIFWLLYKNTKLCGKAVCGELPVRPSCVSESAMYCQHCILPYNDEIYTLYEIHSCGVVGSYVNPPESR